MYYTKDWNGHLSGVQSSFGVHLHHTGLQDAASARQLQRVSLHRHVCDWYVDPVGLFHHRLHAVPAEEFEELVHGHSSLLQSLLGPDLPILPQNLRCAFQ